MHYKIIYQDKSKFFLPSDNNKSFIFVKNKHYGYLITW